MPESNVWNYQIPLVQPGDPVADSSVNTPVSLLANRTQVLKTLLDSIEAGQNIIYRNVPLASTVDSGEVVYLDTTTYTYTPALAIYGELVATEGVLEPARSAYFTGLVVSKNGSLGDVLMSGIHQLDNDQLLALFGTATPASGDIYYLSDGTAGQVTAVRPPLSVDCVEYMGNGLVRVFQPAFNNLTHTHREYGLEQGGWIVTSSFPAEIVPAGAIRGYDFTLPSAVSDNLAEILLPSVGGGVYTWAHNDPVQTLDGRRVEAGHILLDENGLWWMEAVVPTSDIWFNNTAAIVGDIPVLNTVVNRSPDQLDIEILDGTVYIGHKDYTYADDTAGSTVVKEIVGGVAKRGLVVEKLQVGAGLSLSGTGQGNVTITLAQYHDYQIASQILNLNQAVTEVGGIIPITKFPADRDSKVNCSVTLIDLPDDTLYEAYVYMLVYGIGSLFSGIDVTLQTLVDPVPAGSVPAVPTGFPSTMEDIPAGTNIYRIEVAQAIDLTGLTKGTMYYELGIDTPGSDIQMLQTGVRLALK